MVNYRDWMRARKRAYVVRALSHVNGSTAQAARLLGINRTYLNKLVLQMALDYKSWSGWPSECGNFEVGDYRAYVAACKHSYIVELMAQANNSATKAARLSGLSRPYLSKLAPRGRKLKRGNWGTMCDKQGRDIGVRA